jgi:hypothetical protein
LSVTAPGCARPTAPVRLATAGPSLAVVFSTPALPDAKSQPLRAGYLTAAAARFETFSITADVFRNMGAADCELVQDFARQILPTLATRDLTQDIDCVTYPQGGARFLVKGEILKSLPER